MFILYIVTAVLGLKVFIGSFHVAKGTADEKFDQSLSWFIQLLAFIALFALTLFLTI